MIIFKNKGEIDVDSIITFGINVKESENPIGFFGTGLKYAIAVLLRHNQEIIIHSGLSEYHFTTKSKMVRGQEFNFIYMNDKQLAFTTELGKNWEMWMAYRELYCNAIDEGGEIGHFPNGCLMSEKGFTNVYVIGKAFEEAHNSRQSFILSKNKVVASNEDIVAYEGTTQSVFYRGIKALQLILAPAMFHYNILRECELTEDRTLKWRHQAEFAAIRLILGSEDEEFLRRVLTAPRGLYEHQFDYAMPDMDPGPTFLQVVGELREKDGDLNVNTSAVIMHRRFVSKSVLPLESVEINSIQVAQLDRASLFVEKYLECDMSKYPIIVLNNLGPNMLGRAEDGKIFLSVKVFEQGTKRVAAALYEEYVHLETGCRDESPEQHWIYLEKILSLGEQLFGEPL